MSRRRGVEGNIVGSLPTGFGFRVGSLTAAKALKETRGEVEVYAETIVRLLSYRMGALDSAIRERVRKVSDLETLKPWYEEALLVIDAEGAQKLAEKIRNAPLP